MESVVLDRIDHIILSALIDDGRASYAELGKITGLSPHATAARVRRLVSEGIITGFTASISFEAIGRPLEAVINVRLAPTADPADFERIAAQMPAVRELAFVTGRFDYFVRVACVDADDLGATVLLLRREAGAVGTETHLVMRSSTTAPDSRLSVGADDSVHETKSK